MSQTNNNEKAPDAPPDATPVAPDAAPDAPADPPAGTPTDPPGRPATVDDVMAELRALTTRLEANHTRLLEAVTVLSLQATALDARVEELTALTDGIADMQLGRRPKRAPRVPSSHKKASRE